MLYSAVLYSTVLSYHILSCLACLPGHFLGYNCYSNTSINYESMKMGDARHAMGPSCISNEGIACIPMGSQSSLCMVEMNRKGDLRDHR